LILSNKSAKKVPKKNMLNPKSWVAGRIFDTAFKPLVGIKVNGNNVTIQSTVNAMVSQVVEVKPNTSYTAFHGSDANGRGVYVYSISGTDLTPANKLSPNTFNSGNNTKVIIGLYKSTSANNLSEIEFVNPMMVEGLAVVPFEPYEANNRKAKGTPTKNLIPNFNYSGWFQDSTLAGGVMNVDPTDPHKMKLVLSQSAQARLIHIPVQIGKSYTFNFGKITGLYRIYKSKVTFHDAPKALIQDSVPAPFTFTVDASYNGYVTLRVTQGYAGTFSFENLQLVEGWWNITTFEPYKEVLKKAKLVPKKNLIEMDLAKWTVRANTSNVKIEGSKISWQASATYGGVNFLLDPVLYAGKTITFSRGEQNSGAAATAFFKRADGTGAYFGLGTSSSVTVTLPLGITELRFYVQNADEAIAGKTYYVTDLQAEIGTSATTYETFKLGSKKPVSSIVKAPLKLLPYSYLRESVELVGNVQYGMNNPRFKNGGLLIEEGTYNYVTAGSTMQEVKVPNPTTYAQKRWSHSHPNGGKTLTVDKQYTLSFDTLRTGAEGKNFSSVVVGGVTNGDAWNVRLRPDQQKPFVIPLADGWERWVFPFTIKANTQYLQTFLNFITDTYESQYVCLVKNVQLEEKAFGTSFTDLSRKHDKATIPNVVGVLDSGGGSISIKTKYDNLELAKLWSGFYFDTSSNARWFCNYDSNIKKFQLVLNGIGLIQLPDTVLQKENDVLITWTNKTVSMTVNGVSGTATGSGATVNTGIMTLGTRFTVDNAWLNGSITEFEIKDRNGNTTFKI